MGLDLYLNSKREALLPNKNYFQEINEIEDEKIRGLITRLIHDILDPEREVYSSNRYGELENRLVNLDNTFNKIKNMYNIFLVDLKKINSSIIQIKNNTNIVDFESFFKNNPINKYFNQYILNKNIFTKNYLNEVNLFLENNKNINTDNLIQNLINYETSYMSSKESIFNVINLIYLQINKKYSKKIDEIKKAKENKKYYQQQKEVNNDNSPSITYKNFVREFSEPTDIIYESLFSPLKDIFDETLKKNKGLCKNQEKENVLNQLIVDLKVENLIKSEVKIHGNHDDSEEIKAAEEAITSHAYSILNWLYDKNKK